MKERSIANVERESKRINVAAFDDVPGDNVEVL